MDYSTSEQAEKYARELVRKKYPDINLDEFFTEIREDISEDIWIFSAALRSKNYTKGGVGIIVKFKGEDGSVTYIARQKQVRIRP